MADAHSEHKMATPIPDRAIKAEPGLGDQVRPDHAATHLPAEAKPVSSQPPGSPSGSTVASTSTAALSVPASDAVSSRERDWCAAKTLYTEAAALVSQLTTNIAQLEEKSRTRQGYMNGLLNENRADFFREQSLNLYQATNMLKGRFSAKRRAAVEEEHERQMEEHMKRQERRRKEIEEARSAIGKFALQIKQLNEKLRECQLDRDIADKRMIVLTELRDQEERQKRELRRIDEMQRKATEHRQARKKRAEADREIKLIGAEIARHQERRDTEVAKFKVAEQKELDDLRAYQAERRLAFVKKVDNEILALVMRREQLKDNPGPGSDTERGHNLEGR